MLSHKTTPLPDTHAHNHTYSVKKFHFQAEINMAIH